MSVELGESEFNLDVVWGAIHNENDRWNQILPGTLGCSRKELVAITGWSYSTIYRLIDVLVKRGQVKPAWTHQHQSYWEAHYSIVEE